MRWLLDTNVISELRKGDRCDRGVAAWFADALDEELVLSVLVVGEIRRGIEAIRRRDPRSAARLEGWLRRVIADFGERMLPVDLAVADEWGRISAERPLPTVDGLLAATARIHGLTVVTRNVADIAECGAICLNPFADASG